LLYKILINYIILCHRVQFLGLRSYIRKLGSTNNRATRMNESANKSGSF